MATENSNGFVKLDNDPDENGMQGAFVSIESKHSVDEDLHNIMDNNAQDIVSVFARGIPV